MRARRSIARAALNCARASLCRGVEWSVTGVESESERHASTRACDGFVYGMRACCAACAWGRAR